ncbi:MAG: ribose 5-phosphate isomerase B [Calditrichaeota bacterium]|nr:ribose 5-phosphate isomerase B [Calditrichota bacterium]
MKKIAIGCDHAGYHFKTLIAEFLTTNHYTVIDKGTNSSDSVDYPDYAKSVGESVSTGDADLGILVCGSGIGVSIVANKIRGCRAALCLDVKMAEMSKLHNNANILCLGERLTEEADLIPIVEKWLNTEFEGGRHQRRVDKIHDLTGC